MGYNERIRGSDHCSSPRRDSAGLEPEYAVSTMQPAAGRRPARNNRLVEGPSDEFAGALRGARRLMVVGHVTPDSDCLGASLALVLLLRQAGREAALHLPRLAVAKKLRFMLSIADGEMAGAPGARNVPPVSAATAEWRGDCDAVVIVDTANARRVNVDGGADALAGRTTLVIDHHITNPDFGRYNWVDPHASSTSEMVAGLAGHLNWALTPTTASLLYAGIHGDTAGFSLPNTTSGALQAAAGLIRAGADVTHIGEQLCRSQERHDFELLRRVYDHTRATEDGRMAYSFLTYDDITASGCTAEDIDDQVSIPRALAGIRIALLFTEGEPGVVRVNLRGEGRTSVLEIAEHFGGGGHTQSAGVRIRSRGMPQVIEEVLAVARQHLERSAGG